MLPIFATKNKLLNTFNFPFNNIKYFVCLQYNFSYFNAETNQLKSIDLFKVLQIHFEMIVFGEFENRKINGSMFEHFIHKLDVY